MGNRLDPLEYQHEQKDKFISQSMDSSFDIYNKSIDAFSEEKERESRSKQQGFVLERLHSRPQDISGFNVTNLCENLQQGVNIVSISNNGKKRLLISFFRFKNEKDYNNFTNTLIYRTKMLQSCQKAKKYLNQIIGIYSEKQKFFSACGSSNEYKVYILQKYSRKNIETFFEDESLSMVSVYELLHSFTKVMSAYQYKRLRFGSIDFSQIYVARQHVKQKPKSISSIITPASFNNGRRQQKRYICKVRDPFIRKYFSFSLNADMQGRRDSKAPVEDVYKNDVHYVGLSLKRLLQSKIEKNNLMTEASEPQKKAAQFLYHLINKHMICPINQRYNWLQIQRHFQQLNIYEQATQPTSPMQPNKRSLNSVEHQDTHIKSSSLGKPMELNSSNINSWRQGVRLGGAKKEIKFNQSLNKENIENQMGANNFIALKPMRKNESKQNIALSTKNVNNNSQTQYFKGSTHSNQSIIPNKNISIVQLQQSILTDQAPSVDPNSGYRIVENPHPQQITTKIKYDNLFNIGKSWGKFQGNFVDGLKEGLGTIYLTNGHIFTGFFSKDLANGKGSLYVNGELVLKGNWKNNQLQSQF